MVCEIAIMKKSLGFTRPSFSDTDIFCPIRHFEEHNKIQKRIAKINKLITEINEDIAIISKYGQSHQPLWRELNERCRQYVNSGQNYYIRR